MFVRYKNETYDLSKFTKKHPGGINTLNGMWNSDIDYKFEEAMPHSEAAKYLLMEYKVSNKTNENNLNDVNSNRTDSIDGQQNANCDSDGANKIINNDIFIKTDDSMEHLVDWSRGMLSQIRVLNNNYTEWVNKPVDRPLRLFDSNLLESLTKTPWWLVPSIWIPIISLILNLGINDAFSRNYGYSFVLTYVIIGVFLWTLLEYSLHRWVFHMNSMNQNQYICTFHFLLHGLHHKVPFDQYRLVFPPVPATILATIIYQPISVLFECPKLVIAGGLLGYVTYDMIHYYIHNGSPNGGHFYYMKRYHYQHHFVHHDQGFGISSSIWDEAFGTKIVLRKLRYLLKW